MYDTVTKGQYGFPMMAEILQPATHGTASLTHYTITEERLKFDKMRAMFNRDWTFRGLKAGTYAVLKLGGHTVMSDTWIERMSNVDVVEQSQGNVLIGGLGIGLILTLILDKPQVKAITVLEKSPDVIALISPYFQHPKLTIIEADVFQYQTKDKFNTIYFDIWADLCSDNADEIGKLHRKYMHKLDRSNGHWMASWLQEEMRALRREGRWR